MKTEADIPLIKTCKQENIIPTFVKVKFSIKHGNKKLHSKIARLAGHLKTPGTQMGCPVGVLM